MSKASVLIYLVRQDLRVGDNPILHHLSTSPEHGFDYLLPVYVFPARQVELSGLVVDGSESPFPEARSRVGRFWRCGPHRLKFMAESVWNMKENLEAIGSGLAIRAGRISEVARDLIAGVNRGKANARVAAVWMVDHEATEEKATERAVAAVCKKMGTEFKLWQDEKYFIDDRDHPFSDAEALPDIFTTYRKMMEPLRERPRPSVPRPDKSSLPAYPSGSMIAPQRKPFVIPNSYVDLEEALLKPVREVIPDAPEFPEGAVSAHPFRGGEDGAMARLVHLIRSGAMSSYKDTRNGLLGSDFSTKLSGYLAQGCVTARQIHNLMAAFESGLDESLKGTPGFGAGENDGTQAVRLELLWRDYMRLCSKKFGHRLFSLTGFREDNTYKWKTASGEAARPNQQPSADEVAATLGRFWAGTTGMGLIDASMRELLHTGYTSNRARQNVAGFLSKHLGIDWRYGAEWYEMLLVDYDAASNWANWQYVSGVGNDPRGEARIFNPVKQAFDYDRDGAYVRAWLPELRQLDRLENLFQPWTTPRDDWARLGLEGNQMVHDPVKRIDFSVEAKPRTIRRTNAAAASGSSSRRTSKRATTDKADESSASASPADRRQSVGSGGGGGGGSLPDHHAGAIAVGSRSPISQRGGSSGFDDGNTPPPSSGPKAGGGGGSSRRSRAQAGGGGSAGAPVGMARGRGGGAAGGAGNVAYMQQQQHPQHPQQHQHQQAYATRYVPAPAFAHPYHAPAHGGYYGQSPPQPPPLQQQQVVVAHHHQQPYPPYPHHQGGGGGAGAQRHRHRTHGGSRGGGGNPWTAQQDGGGAAGGGGGGEYPNQQQQQQQHHHQQPPPPAA